MTDVDKVRALLDELDEKLKRRAVDREIVAGMRAQLDAGMPAYAVLTAIHRFGPYRRLVYAGKIKPPVMAVG